MVSHHEVIVKGVSLAAQPARVREAWHDKIVAHVKPTLLQLNDEDFPARFFTDLASLGPTPGSSMLTLSTSPSVPATLYQPVHRILHATLLQLACDTLNYPRLDPKRVESGGLVIRRVVRQPVPGRPDLPQVDRLDLPPSAWMRSADGQFQWVALDQHQECEDPDPTQRPQLQSGQPELDRQLALQQLSTAKTEIYTPAFVAPPAVCDAAGHTFVYATIPTASSDVSSIKTPPPQYDRNILAKSLPKLLRHGNHSAPMRDQPVNYQYMSDDYAKANPVANSGPGFQTFSSALRMMYTVYGAFDDTPQAQSLIATLNRHNVHLLTSSGTAATEPLAMGTFYQQAAVALINYRPNSGAPVPQLTMPHTWDPLTRADENDILDKVVALLQLRSTQVTTPLGRFQDASRLYRIRVFLRVKSDMPGCPPKLVWSQPSDPFRIAAWHESAGRTQPPVPLPDPTDPNFLNNVKPNCSFAVPAGLMNAIQGTSLSGLTAGSGSTSTGIQLNWICGFSIPLITICAFFVLNIFLTLLNLVFFWLPFIKICIPFPVPTASNSGGTNDP